jgi:hypothetical protein
MLSGKHIHSAKHCQGLLHLCALSDKVLSIGMDKKKEKEKEKDPHAVHLGRLGGKARKRKLTAEQRREIARKAAETRWARYDRK